MRDIVLEVFVTKHITRKQYKIELVEKVKSV